MKTPNFEKNFEKKVQNTIKKYKLLEKKDRVLVAASGGKDSTAVLYILKKSGYKVEALYINLALGKYSQNCLDALREMCKEYNIKLHVVDTKKYFVTRFCDIKIGKLSNCIVCGVVKKWLLNKEARRLKADKIATGHNLDDEAQTVIINFLQGNLMLGANSGPITGSIKDKKFTPRIKPLFFMPEENIRQYSKMKKLQVVYEKCPCAVSSLRIRTRAFLNKIPARIKLNIVNNFQKIIPELQSKLYKKKIIYCKLCGEPSRTGICKKCQLLKIGL